jgi:lipopolysaccharide biosynthesis glycosyltransferase
MSNAYVTFVKTDDYLPGVLALKKSLFLYNSNIDFVVLTTKMLSNKALKILKSVNCKIKIVEDIENPSIENIDKSTFNHYTKLRVFEMIEYIKIIFLDADLIVCSNIETLFSAQHMSSVIAGGLITENKWSDLNGGLLVIEPSIQLFKKMLAAVSYLPSSDKSDQGFLHSFYKNWPQNKKLHLDHKFNVPIQYLDTYCKEFNYRFSYIEKELVTNIAVLHFWGPVKPWAIHPDSAILEDTQKVKQAINLWWDIYEEALEDIIKLF